MRGFADNAMFGRWAWVGALGALVALLAVVPACSEDNGESPQLNNETTDNDPDPDANQQNDGFDAGDDADVTDDTDVDPNGQNHGQPCIDDDDCADDQFCDAGVCAEDPCYDVDCADDEVCHDGDCVGEDDLCENISDCDDGEICEEGVCVEVGGPCLDDDDCDAGEICDAGYCIDEDDVDPWDDDTPCGTVKSLGTLDEGDEFTVEVDFEDFDNDDAADFDLSTDCAEMFAQEEVDPDDPGDPDDDPDLYEGPLGIYEFETVQFDSLDIFVDADTDDVAIEINPGPCNDVVDGPPMMCEEGAAGEMLYPGTQHHLLIEPIGDDAPDSVELEIIVDEVPTCFDDDGMPMDGGRACLDEDIIEDDDFGDDDLDDLDFDGMMVACDFLVTSADTPREYFYSCPTRSCIEGEDDPDGDPEPDFCEGDRCDNPIEVTPDEPFFWQGSTRGFFDEHNSMAEFDEAEDNSSFDPCSDDDDCSGAEICNDEGECVREITCTTDVDAVTGIDMDDFDDDDVEVMTPDTPGRDMIFELSDFDEDDIIELTIEHNQPEDVVALFKTGCEDTDPCLSIVANWDEIADEDFGDDPDDDDNGGDDGNGDPDEETQPGMGLFEVPGPEEWPDGEIGDELYLIIDGFQHEYDGWYEINVVIQDPDELDDDD